MRWIRAVIAAVVVVLAVACSGGTAGTPVAELWDPCSIPSEAIAGAGVDPGIIDSRSVDGADHKSRVCTFKKDWYYLTIYATTQSIDELGRDQRATELISAPIAGRPGIAYRDSTQPKGSTCFSSLETGFGAVEFEVQQGANDPLLDDTCQVSRRLASALEGSIPE